MTVGNAELSNKKCWEMFLSPPFDVSGCYPLSGALRLLLEFGILSVGVLVVLKVTRVFRRVYKKKIYDSQTKRVLVASQTRSPEITLTKPSWLRAAR